jgi:tyrosinase
MLNDVIPDYDPNTQEILKAEAVKFRLPYWDWAEKKTRTGQEFKIYDLPLIVQQEKVQVTLPGGKSETISNPFWCFNVGDRPAMGEYGITPVQISADNQPYQAVPVRPQISLRNLVPIHLFHV